MFNQPIVQGAVMEGGYDCPKTVGSGDQAKAEWHWEEIETQVERPKCGPKEDWDERVTDAGDWKKVHTFCSYWIHVEPE